MEGGFFAGANSFLSTLDEQLPNTEKGHATFQNAYQAVVDQLAPEVKENYARYQKLAFYRRYVRSDSEPLVLAYNRILAKMVANKAAEVANAQMKQNGKV